MKSRLSARLHALRGQYAVLFVTLLVVMVLYPFTFSTPVRVLVTIAVFGTMLAALAESWSKRVMFFIGSSLALGVVSSAVSVEAGFQRVEPIQIGLRLAFYGLFCFNIFASIIRDRKVTMNTVFGASAVYLLMALVWGDLYHLVEIVYPGSFLLGSAEAVKPFGSMTEDARLLYFSIVTMTTVGYGDMAPLTPPARMLAGLQGLVAQLYLAIIIARLIGMELSHHEPDPPK